MDLVCGRTQPGSWQALVVVSLATLEGGDEPAEIPGLGLISAPEARDLLQQADLRRAVVDEHGTLVSVDSTVHRPDQSAGPVPQHGCGHSHQSEPDLDADRAPEVRPDDQDDPALTRLLSTLTSHHEQQLTALLHHHTRRHGTCPRRSVLVLDVTTGPRRLLVLTDPPPDDPPPDRPPP